MPPSLPPSTSGTLTWPLPSSVSKVSASSTAIPTTPQTSTTSYHIFGSLITHPPNVRPLIILHGGPGAGHEYLLNLTELTVRHGIPTIFYDQIGCAASTHFREKMNDRTFWGEEIFITELENLVRELGLNKAEGGYDLLGQSWGGQLAMIFAARKPAGLRRVVNSSGPADVREWEVAAKALMGRLPADVQETLRRCEEKGDFESEEWEAALGEYYKRFMCKCTPWPDEELQRGFEHLGEDPTSYVSMQGPSETVITGVLKDWNFEDRMHLVDVPVLLLNGEDDEAQDNTVLPWFRGIKRIRWFTFDGASHMMHLEQPEKYLKIVADFLLDGA